PPPGGGRGGLSRRDARRLIARGRRSPRFCRSRSVGRLMSGRAQYNERELLRAETACRSGFAGAFSSEPADCVLPLPSCFLASTAGVFGFDAGSGFCLPVWASPPDS